LLLKQAPVTKGIPRKRYSPNKALDYPTLKERANFDSVQKALSSPTILVHFDCDRILWIDLDASKEFRFGVVVFHLKKDFVISIGKWPTRTQIEPIMFLSRSLTQAERNFWPTELEVAGFV